jgi:release factor glutamine methyltransferase
MSAHCLVSRNRAVKVDHLFLYVCSMTVQEATRQLLFQLFHIYEQREAANIADLVMERVTEWKKIDRVLNKAVPLSDEKVKLLARYTDELLSHKPVQYVLNEAWFYGMNLFVDENVLIPRPETEELVKWVLDEVKHYAVHQGKALSLSSLFQQPAVLDVGSGSGCIALALKKQFPAATVYSCDVSEKALEVARTNATAHRANINFIPCDFLNAVQRDALPHVDFIVSNPPYVPMQNKSAMSLHVVDHEPHLALFVEDSDPLIFYKAIAAFSKTHVAAKGQIFVELHEDMGDAVMEVFALHDFQEIELKKDMQGKTRLLRAVTATNP